MVTPWGGRWVGMIRVVWWDMDNRREELPSIPHVEVKLLRTPPLDRETRYSSNVLIAEAHDLQRIGTRQSLLSFLESRGRPPVLLLTSIEPDNIRFLEDLSVEDLAWAFERDEEVFARALRLCRVPERTHLGEHLLRSVTECDCVKTALKRVFLDPTPISKVHDLARACFVSPRTLERNWKASRPQSCSASVKALVDWGLLFRARELHRRGLSPHEIARVLGIHVRTLRRLPDRLVG